MATNLVSPFTSTDNSRAAYAVLRMYTLVREPSIGEFPPIVKEEQNQMHKYKIISKYGNEHKNVRILS